MMIRTLNYKLCLPAFVIISAVLGLHLTASAQICSPGCGMAAGYRRTWYRRWRCLSHSGKSDGKRHRRWDFPKQRLRCRSVRVTTGLI